MINSATKEDSELAKIKRETTIETDKIIKTTFRVFKLTEDPQTFDEQRYVNLKRIVQKLSRTKRSVQMVNELLDVIFRTSDVANLESKDHEKQLLCVQMKFQICKDLAISCKISIQNLLKHASHKIYGRITQMLMMNPDIIKVINHFITLNFYQDYILHKSWYYLL